MAHVAAVYTVSPWVRTPVDVLQGLRPSEEKAATRPAVRRKRVWASLTHAPAKVVDEAFRDALSRDPDRKRRWVVLVEGNADQLKLVKKAAKKHAVRNTIVLDVIHVLGSLWNVAHAIYGDGTKDGESWVTTRLMWLLQGRSGNEIAADILRTMRRLEPGPDKRGIFERAAGYVKKHRAYVDSRRTSRTGCPSPPESSRVRAGTSSRTAWSEPARAGRSPVPRRSCACVRSSRAETSRTTGRSTSHASIDFTTPHATPTAMSPIPPRLAGFVA